jgi:hypothetical protein
MKRRTHGKQGSGLFLVLIISTALGIGIYSTLDLVTGEQRRNYKSLVYHEAKQAAESILQSSIADLKRRFETSTNFPIDTLSPERNPLEISDEFASIYNAQDSGSFLIIPQVRKYTSEDQFNSQPTEVIGGQVPPGEWRFIDPRVPGNENDELAGTRVFERNVEMIGKATVERPSVGSATVYARQFLQVRDSPLFAYALFYNLPMEIAPGPAMSIYGNVHVNGDAWVQAGNSLNFHSKFTTAGQLFHGRHPDSGQRASQSPVRFADASGDLINLKADNTWPEATKEAFGNNWLTSLADNFYNLANQLFDGNLQTVDHGVHTQTPVGVSEYIEDIDPTTSRKESFNSAYNLIQPILPESELTIPSESVDPVAFEEALLRKEREQQKYAYKAGLLIDVAADGTISYRSYERDAANNLIYDASGQPTARSLEPEEAIAVRKIFSENEDGEVVNGLHDKRQAADLNIVEIDIEKLKELIHDNEEEEWGGEENQRPDNWWNGVVYVKFPQQNSVSTREDYVNPAISGWGVKLVNGKTIPNPSFAHDRDIYGTTIATNQMLYVEGHYNADGDKDTGSPTEPDDPDNFGREGHEAPAALIADSITFLSESWNDEDSAKSLSERRASNTEVSAAIMTGLVPSGETGSNSYSGGVENFPRFLENWSSRSLTMRGSIVALFESEVGTRRWGYGDVYSAPRRDWGFNAKFAEGFLPPGTPNARRYRSVDFQLVNKAEYETHVSRIKSYY